MSWSWSLLQDMAVTLDADLAETGKQLVQLTRTAISSAPSRERRRSGICGLYFNKAERPLLLPAKFKRPRWLGRRGPAV